LTQFDAQNADRLAVMLRPVVFDKAEIVVVVHAEFDDQPLRSPHVLWSPVEAESFAPKECAAEFAPLDRHIVVACRRDETRGGFCDQRRQRASHRAAALTEPDRATARCTVALETPKSAASSVIECSPVACSSTSRFSWLGGSLGFLPLSRPRALA